MSPALSSALGKSVALMLLIASVALAYISVAQPVFSRIVELEDKLIAERMLLGRLRGVVATANREQPEDAVTAKASERNADNLFLSGESAGVMAAQVQDILHKMARANGMNLASMRNVGIRQHDALSLVGIDARIEGGLEGLQGMLLALEASRPVLLVDALQIATTTEAVPRGTVTEGDTRLNVRMLVLGASRERLGDK
ncbi:MAG: type II secretion system protein M [Alphaproteobacteria bacterium]|nr:type II secretion system protein M [Alphaproteobacteria bacterium]